MHAHNGIMRSSAHASLRIMRICALHAQNTYPRIASYKPNAYLRIKYASSAHMRHCASSALMHMCV